MNFCNRLALIDFDVSLSYPPYSSLPHHPIYQHKQYDGIKVISILYLYLYTTLLDYAQDYENIHFKCNHHF